MGLYAYELNRDSTEDSRHEVNREQVDSSSDPRVNFDEVQEMINKADEYGRALRVALAVIFVTIVFGAIMAVQYGPLRSKLV